MKPITTCYTLFIILLAFAACQPNLKSRTNHAIETAKSHFSNLGVVSAREYELVRKLEITSPNATIQLLQPTRQSDGEGQIIVLSNARNQFYAVPLPPTRYKSYWNFVYDTTPALKALRTKTFEIELNKALDTLGLNTGYDGFKVLNELFASVLQARQISRFDTPALKLMDIGPHSYPDSCVDMINKTYEQLVKPIREDKYWFGHLYIDNFNRILQVNFLPLKKDKKTYYHFSLFRRPCVLDVKPLYL